MQKYLVKLIEKNTLISPVFSKKVLSQIIEQSELN